jgi:lysophospholipase L1-like esterase
MKEKRGRPSGFTGRHIKRISSALFFLAASVFAAAPNAPWMPKAADLPESPGRQVAVRTVEQLFTAVKDAQPGDSIALADGTYRMPVFLDIRTDRVTLRGASGNRDAVIIDGSDSRHGELIGITGCSGVTIANLTVQNIKWNGIKINADKATQAVTIYNCVLHNIWQRGVKSPNVPKNKQALSPRNCRVQYCLFYNDRPKRFSDDETDTANRFNGNYIGGIDVKNTIDWQITDNVFIGIQGRTREGRGCIYISENGQGCLIARNIFLDSDIGIALGNPSLGYSQHQAINCIARDNLVVDCPETGILACYTKDCRIENNTVVESDSQKGRLLWVQKSNEGLQATNNTLVGAPIRLSTKSMIESRGTRVSLEAPDGKKVQTMRDWLAALKSTRPEPAALPRIPIEVMATMRKLHAGFRGQEGYVAQFGDSITYSMAFWSAMNWAAPDTFLSEDDDLARRPPGKRWRGYIKGARDKGQAFANYSGWRVGQLLKAMPPALARNKPVAAMIMIGTNDIAGGTLPVNYAGDLARVVDLCLAAHCVPILNTIPPRRDRDEAVAAANQVIRELAASKQIPLADFHAACIRLRPGGSWDGSLISKDGIHPSGGKTHDYDDSNLKTCGYALRNWVNFLILRQLVVQVFEQ